MPTTKGLILFSWISAVLGILLAADIVFFKQIVTKPFVTATLVALGGFAVAMVLRALANTGQLVFDLGRDACTTLHQSHQEMALFHQDVSKYRKEIEQGIIKYRKEIEQDIAKYQQKNENYRHSLVQEVLAFRNFIEQVSCDSKDINQSAYQIKEKSESDLNNIVQSMRQANNLLLEIKNRLHAQ